MKDKLIVFIVLFLSFIVIFTPAVRYIAEVFLIFSSNLKYGNVININGQKLYVDSNFLIIGKKSKQYSLSKKFDFDQSLILVSSEKELGFDIASLYKRQVVNQISNTHECLIFKNSGFTEDLADYFIQLKKHELVISLWQKSDYVSPHDLCLTFHSDNVIAKFEKE